MKHRFRARGLSLALAIATLAPGCVVDRRARDPGWPLDEEVRLPTEHFVVRCRLDVDRAIEVGRLAERSWDLYRRYLGGERPRAGPRVVVTVFRDRELYRRYAVARSSGRRVPLSYYSPVDNEVAVLDNDAFLFHELFHAFFKNEVGVACQWLDEGFAQCFESLALDEEGRGRVAERPERRLYFVTMLSLFHPEALEHPPLAIEDVVRFNENDYRRMVNRENNPMFHFGAWALAFYILHHPTGPDEAWRLVREYVERLRAGEESWEAFRAVFDVESAPEMRERLKRFYGGLEHGGSWMRLPLEIDFTPRHAPRCLP